MVLGHAVIGPLSVTMYVRPFNAPIDFGPMYLYLEDLSDAFRCHYTMRVHQLSLVHIIKRTEQLQWKQPRSWLEEGLKRLMNDERRGTTLMWVKGHSGNEGADRKAKEIVVAFE